jgi:hypothetical protein
MPAAKQQSAELVDLRYRLGTAALSLTDRDLKKVLKTALNDVDLAYTAITMVPRPAWLTDLIGAAPG